MVSDWCERKSTIMGACVAIWRKHNALGDVRIQAFHAMLLVNDAGQCQVG